MTQRDAEPTLQRHRYDQNVVTATLDNGLRVIIREDRRSPVAICHTWVHVGSNYEPDHLRGWSHGIEHMLFKGTERRSEGDFAREVAEAGGATNAGTGYETTSYHITVPREQLTTACDILGDTLFSATFAADALDAERQVLVHENHMYDDLPYGFGITWRWIMELAYDRSPYRYPIGGQDEELLAAPREQIIAFYRTAYRPKNVTVVVAGDVDAVQTLALIRERFRAPARHDGELIKPPVEPPHLQPRYRIERGDIQKAYAKLLFSCPSDRSPRRTTLSVVERILSDGRSCRLYREVQERQQLVNNIYLMSEIGAREGAIICELETDVARLADALRAAVGVFEELKDSGPTTDELQRASARALRTFRFQSETVQGQAANLGYFDAVGDLDGAFTFPDRVAAVTAADVASLCRDVFRLGGLTCLVYLPRDADAAAAGLPHDAADLTRLLGPVLSDAPPPDMASEQPVTAGTAATNSVPTASVHAPLAGAPTARISGPVGDSLFTETELPEGLHVCYRVDRSLPVVAIALYARGASCLESADTAGLAALTQQVQVKGTDGRSSEEIHAAVENQGASLAPHIERDFTGIALTALAERLEPALELWGSIACRPSFPDAEVDHELRQARDRLQAIDDDPFQFAGVQLRALMFGDHPYGRPLVGSVASLARLSTADLRAQHTRLWRPRNLSLVISGDCDPDTLLPRCIDLLADLPVGEPPHLPDLRSVATADGVVRRRFVKDRQQSAILAAWPGPPDPDTDRVELLLLRELLDGQSGRLFEELRNRRSLCYNTGFMGAAGLGPGLLVGYVMTDPESEDAALTALVDQLVRSADAPPAADELRRARAKLTGNLLIANQSNSSRVARCIGDQVYGRSANDLPRLIAAIGACEPEAIRSVAERYFDPDRRYELLVGPAMDTTKKTGRPQADP